MALSNMEAALYFMNSEVPSAETLRSMFLSSLLAAERDSIDVPVGLIRSLHDAWCEMNIAEADEPDEVDNRLVAFEQAEQLYRRGYAAAYLGSPGMVDRLPDGTGWWPDCFGTGEKFWAHQLVVEAGQLMGFYWKAWEQRAAAEYKRQIDRERAKADPFDGDDVKF